MTFGEHIRHLRETKGLRPEAIALECDCSVTTVLNWENTQSIPVGLTRFARLADALNISLDDLANLGANVEDQEGVAA